MSSAIVCRMKPYIQPFERRLAVKELQALAGSSPCVHADGHVEVQADTGAKELASRLSFFETVRQGGKCLYLQLPQISGIFYTV